MIPLTAGDPPERSGGGGLPRQPGELRRDLRRRLALMEREVRALADGSDDPRVLASVVTLEEMERRLRDRLAVDGEPEGWGQWREEIVGLWRRHRQEFERLAARCRRKHTARSGRRESGPRW